MKVMKKINKEQLTAIAAVVSYNFGKEIYSSDTLAVYQFEGYIGYSQSSVRNAMLCGLDVIIEPVAYHVFRLQFRVV